MRKLRALALAVLFAASPSKPHAAERASLEDQVQTAFLYNFTKYVRWPDEVSAGDFQIAVIGESGIVAALKDLAHEKQVGGRRIRIAVLDSVEALGRCHILFVNCAERERLGEILRKTRGRSILTVGGCAGMAGRGAALNFMISEGKMRFAINRRAVERAGLEMSSQLLKLAILVEEEDDADD